jgi:hypothetical protein
MATWIDCEYGTEIGTIGYLVETTNTNTGRTTWSLRERPLRTNQSNEPRLTGWCGETDNRTRFAHGVVKVVALNAPGDRAKFIRLRGVDLAVFLADNGHPGLMPEKIGEAWDKGSEDGIENVDDVLREQGADAVIATLAAGCLGWDEAAINAGAHKIAGIADDMKDVYYRAYAKAARERAEEIRDEHADKFEKAWLRAAEIGERKAQA